MSHRARNRRSFRRQPAGVAWLAIVALFDVLLPAGFTLPARLDQATAAIGFCGTLPGDPPSGNQPAHSLPYHCIHCLVAAIGPLPLEAAGLDPPQSAAAVQTPPSPMRRARFVFAFALAQPRGPPTAA